LRTFLKEQFYVKLQEGEEAMEILIKDLLSRWQKRYATAFYPWGRLKRIMGLQWTQRPWILIVTKPTSFA